MTISNTLKKQKWTTLVKTTIMCLEEIRNRVADSESAMNNLDVPQEGTIEDLIAFEQTDEFQEALRQDQINDIFWVELDNIIATLEDAKEDS